MSIRQTRATPRFAAGALVLSPRGPPLDAKGLPGHGSEALQPLSPLSPKTPRSFSRGPVLEPTSPAWLPYSPKSARGLARLPSDDASANTLDALEQLKMAQAEWRQKQQARMDKQRAHRLTAVKAPHPMELRYRSELASASERLERMERLGDESPRSPGRSSMLPKGSSRSFCSPSGPTLLQRGTSFVEASSALSQPREEKAQKQQKDRSRFASWHSGHSGSEPPERSQSGVEAVVEDLGFDQVMRVARKHCLPIDDVRPIWRDFLKLDANKNGLLDYQEFAQAVRLRCNIPETEPVPLHLLDHQWKVIVNGLDRRSVGFEEYVLWTVNTQFAEEVLVPDEKERILRKVARDHDLLLVDVERLQEAFNRYDTDKSGSICQIEFRYMLEELLSIKTPSDLPRSVLMRYFREADQNSSGEIDFEEFLLWHTKLMPLAR
eukprot:TRINITY_DN59971_c0_g3_i1.p1 TRINITY_DN59971_c0_g3~~TRINITY_DN59971_c0_g3_i1.p1  ORF type:complete len:436 (+),score=84.34 TRINITY_DN59971_c0_g3_i1:118-1425(+)